MTWTKATRDLGLVRELFEDIASEVVELAAMAPTGEAVKRIGAIQRALTVLRTVLFLSAWNAAANAIHTDAGVTKNLETDLRLVSARLAVAVLGVPERDVLAIETTHEGNGARLMRAKLRDGRTLGVRFDRFWSPEVLGEVACFLCEEVRCAEGVL